jgi:hypothetical protein
LLFTAPVRWAQDLSHNLLASFNRFFHHQAI